MKKLLALILCVMLFVSIIPTAAFAVSYPTGATFPTSSGYTPVWSSKKVAQDAVDAASDNIKALYQTLAADKAIFGTVSAIDSFVSSLSKDLWKDTDGLDMGTLGSLSADAAEKATKNLLRDVIGNEIMNYMDDHWQSFATKQDDGTFKIDPMKYMNAFATAASKAVSSEKASKNIEALVLALAAGKTYDDFLDDADDLALEITLWNDGDGLDVWAKYFGQAANTQPWDPYALFEPNKLDNSDYAGIYANIWANS